MTADRATKEMMNDLGILVMKYLFIIILIIIASCFVFTACLWLNHLGHGLPSSFLWVCFFGLKNTGRLLNMSFANLQKLLVNGCP